MTTMIVRGTLFKVPDPENRQKLVEACCALERDQAKDGKPYILQIQPVPVLDDPRSNGHTVMVLTIFANAEDMKYYDTECPAHVALRKTAAKLVTERPLVVNMESREPRAVAAGWN